MKIKLLITLALAASVAVIAAVFPKANKDKESLTLQVLMAVLERLHFAPQKIDDSLSQEIYKEYLDGMDRSKRFLLSSEVEQLAIYKNSIDEQIDATTFEFFNLTNTLMESGTKRAQRVYQSIIDQEISINSSKTLELDGGGQVYGTIHKNTKMVDDIIDDVKSKIPKERWKDIVFVGEGGTTNQKGKLVFNDEMDYAVPKFQQMGAGVDTFDGDELDVHKPDSKLYKKQIEKTGLNQSQVNAGNWASMIGQGEGTDTMKPTTFLDDSGKQFLQNSAKEAGFPEIENWDEPTDKDIDTLYRLSFPKDYGDKETKINDIQVAFNEIRDENIIDKNKELTAQGKIPIIVAGESHVELVKNMISKTSNISEFSLKYILKSINKTY